MNRNKMLTLLLLLSLAAVCRVASAEGWKMPNLNPFKKKDSHPANLRAANNDKGSWWWPKSSQSRSQQPSTWSKMTGGTRRAWTKTKDVLNPFDDEKDKPRSVTGSNSIFSQTATRKPAKKKSSWWSWGAEEKKDPQTVTEWLGQERPY